MNPQPAVERLRDLAVGVVRRWHRLEIVIDAPPPDEPSLLVANHGFGGIVDVNVYATLAALTDAGIDRPITPLVHQLAWTLKVGPLLESAGARPATPEFAAAAFRDGRHVLVLPGGDLDAAKTFRHRNRIVFGGRRGFARLAIDCGVPLVPIVTAGAGESLLVLSDGRRIARVLRTDRLLRQKTLPVTVSLPWGPAVGVVGLLPYLPIPAKLVTAVLPAMRPSEAESAEAFGDRVETAMQRRLDDLTRHRRLLLG